MLGNGDGNGGEGERAKITYEEARQAVGPPRDRVDRVALFAADQGMLLQRALTAHAEAMHGILTHLGERFRNIESEVAKLKAALRRARVDFGGEDEDQGGGGLQ